MAKNAPLYRTTAQMFIGGMLVDAGSEVEYDGEPGTTLEPINDAAKENAKIGERNRKAMLSVNPTIQGLAQALAGLTKPQREEVLAATGQGAVIDPGPDATDSVFDRGDRVGDSPVPVDRLPQPVEPRDPRAKGDPALKQGSKEQAKKGEDEGAGLV